MKAIRVQEFGGPEKMKLQEVPDLKPAKGQVLVRVKAAGVNPVDAYTLAGTYAKKPNLPYSPGMDGAGIVEAFGDEVSTVKIGLRVYVESAATGTYAEACLVDSFSVHPLPDSVSFAQGAAMGVPYATAYRALFGRANAKPGETVLVHGASGGVGTAAVQIARAANMTVLGTAGTTEGLQLVKDQGAHYALDHRASDYVKQFMDLTGGKGADIILEMAAHVNLGQDLSLLSKYGRVVVVGSRGPVEINPRDLMGRDGAILGMTLFNVPIEEKIRIHQDLVKGLSNGSLRPVIGQEFPLAEASKAHEAVLKQGAYGKIVLIP